MSRKNLSEQKIFVKEEISLRSPFFAAIFMSFTQHLHLQQTSKSNNYWMTVGTPMRPYLQFVCCKNHRGGQDESCRQKLINVLEDM